jgi:hypothetical protein
MVTTPEGGATMTNPNTLYELAQVAEQERMNDRLRAAAIRAARREAGPSRGRRLVMNLMRRRP